MANETRRPIKVLNALWHLGVGGIESSLIEILRRLDPEQFRMDFLVTSQYESYYDSAVKEMGGRIVLGKKRLSPTRNLKELTALNERFGPYDVLHSHRHYSGAPLLRAAHQLGMPVRIAHSHAIRTGEGSALDRSGFAIARYLTRRHCTHGLAVSRAAAVSLFGDCWEKDPRFEVLPIACNFDAFRETGSREQVRQELDIGEHEMALAHVGSFTDTKNHEFIVAVARALKAISEDFVIVLIGDGPLRYHIQYMVDYAGLSDRVRFLGTQPNVPALLLAMDAFIFPSKVEALGIAAVEAQAAGLACFLSDQIVPELDLVPELLHRLPLSAGPEAWAREILAHGRAKISQASALEQCMRSDFGSESYVDRLQALYASALD